MLLPMPASSFLDEPGIMDSEMFVGNKMTAGNRGKGFESRGRKNYPHWKSF